ncbi:MAG: tetratricopeptide repeat protein [Planctomycetes bacterium]|nr:tetratricopeptide repeat protein [Planctomycetota bacterium]
MRKILLLIVFFFLLAASHGFETLIYAQADKSLLMKELTHKDEETRCAAVVIIADRNYKSAIKNLIMVLRDEKSPVVIEKINKALGLLTENKLPVEYKDWVEWWDAEGREWYGKMNFTDKDPAEELLAQSRNWMILILVVTGSLAFIVILLMIVFSAMGSNRLKATKEIIKQAEKYIKDSEEITKRNDRILEELENKRVEIKESIAELRDEMQADIEGFSDSQQKNIEHRMREVTMTLREKAEKELEHTLSEIKEDVGREIKKNAADLREKTAVSINEQYAKMQKEIDAHSMYIEASFLLINEKFEDSVRLYQKLLALKPDHYVAWNNLGNAFRKLKRYNDALDAFRKSVEIAPEDAAALYNIAVINAFMKRKDQMLLNLKKAVHFNPELKDEALNDKAFADFWKDADFKDVTEA